MVGPSEVPGVRHVWQPLRAGGTKSCWPIRGQNPLPRLRAGRVGCFYVSSLHGTREVRPLAMHQQWLVGVSLSASIETFRHVANSLFEVLLWTGGYLALARNIGTPLKLGEPKIGTHRGLSAQGNRSDAERVSSECWCRTVTSAKSIIFASALCAGHLYYYLIR